MDGNPHKSSGLLINPVVSLYRHDLKKETIDGRRRPHCRTILGTWCDRNGPLLVPPVRFRLLIGLLMKYTPAFLPSLRQTESSPPAVLVESCCESETR